MQNVVKNVFKAEQRAVVAGGWRVLRVCAYGMFVALKSNPKPALSAELATGHAVQTHSCIRSG